MTATDRGGGAVDRAGGLVTARKVPGASATQPGWGRRSDVQGLRAVAVMLVVAHHAGIPVAGGFTGVDVFFVVSGFVITGMLVAQYERLGHVDLRGFYVRRVHRLLPALGVTSTITAALSILFLSPLGAQEQAGKVGAASSLWASNVALYRLSSSYFAPDVEGNPFLHTWSLAVEEQFYLVFPGLIVLALWWGRRRAATGRASRRAVVGAVGAVALTSFALQILLTVGHSSLVPRPGAFAFYLSPTRAWEFAAGAIIVVAPAITSPWLGRLAGPTGVLLLTAGVLFVSGDQPYPGWGALLPVCGTAALISAGGADRLAFIPSVLSSRAMVWIGDRSYSWYLWHWPFLVFANRLLPHGVLWTTMAVAGSLGAAALSYVWVEERFRLRGRIVRPRPKVVVASVVVPLVVSLVLATGGSALWWLPQLDGLRQLEAQPAKHNTCLNETPVSQRDVAACTWGPDRPGAPIYLVGDSNAQQYTEGVVAAGAKLDRPVVVLTMGSCLPAVMETRGDADNGAPCQRFVTDLLAWLGSQRHGTVLMAGSAEAVFGAGAALRVPGGPWVTSRAAREQVVSSALTAFADQVESKGHAVVIVEALPHLPGSGQPWWLPADCPNWRLVRSPASCGVQFPLAELDRRDAAWLSAQRAAVSRSGARLLPIRRQICPESVCTAEAGGSWVYRDGVHITPKRSAQLGPYLAANLQSPAPRR